MNISRNEVSEFQYASSMAIARDSIFQIGSVDNNLTKVKVTDLKMTCATAVDVKFYVTSYGTYGQALQFKLPADSSHDFHWEIPFNFNISHDIITT